MSRRTQRPLWKRVAPPAPEARLLAALAMVAIVAAFALNNSQPVTVDYLVTTRDSRLFWVIVGSAVIGALADRLLIARTRR